MTNVLQIGPLSLPHVLLAVFGEKRPEGLISPLRLVVHLVSKEFSIGDDHPDRGAQAFPLLVESRSRSHRSEIRFSPGNSVPDFDKTLHQFAGTDWPMAWGITAEWNQQAEPRSMLVTAEIIAITDLVSCVFE
jgi:hypothetical protein